MMLHIRVKVFMTSHWILFDVFVDQWIQKWSSSMEGFQEVCIFCGTYGK